MPEQASHLDARGCGTRDCIHRAGARIMRRGLSRILAVARIEILRLRIDRPSLGLILLVPALQIVLFGYAINLSPANIPIVIARSCGAQEPLVHQVVTDAGAFRLIPTDAQT